MTSISVITPSFNQGKFIERTIQSVLAQKIPNLEYVVIDGGSTDETLSILQRYSSQLRYVSEKDRGQTHAVNKGLMMTSGEIIGWLNSDDVYYPETLQKIMEIFEKNPDVDLIYGKADYINVDDECIEPYPTREWDLEFFLAYCFLCQPAVFFRRRLIEKFGYLEEKLNFCMDYEYWLRLALANVKFYYFQENLAGSRLYPQTKSVGQATNAIKEALNMLRQKIGSVPINWILVFAITKINKDTKLSYLKTKWRFVIAVYLLSIVCDFRWNGLKGLNSFYTMAKGIYSRYQAKLVTQK